MAILTAPTPFAASLMIGGVVVAFVVLWAFGWGAAKLALGVQRLWRWVDAGATGKTCRPEPWDGRARRIE